MIKWFLINTVTLLILTWLLPGFHIENWKVAIVAAAVIGLINITIKPLISLLALPITFLTFGLFSLVINTGMLMLAAYITPGFKIDGWVSAFLGSLLYSLLVTLLNSMTKND